MSPTPPTPAQIYDERFVPALFGPWGPRICERVGLLAGESVLDVACGTGALTLAAAQIVGETGTVVGLDPNPEMLVVAEAKSAGIQWRRGAAEELPLDDDAFDRVVSQFGFMFFTDRVQALREMSRVLRPGGRMVIAVCDGLDHSPGYAVLTELLHRLFGAEVAAAFRAPFALGDRRKLRALVRAAGLQAEVERVDGKVRFSSVDDLVAAERACAWTLGGLLDDDQFDLLRAEANESLAPFVDATGRVSFSMPALCIVG